MQYVVPVVEKLRRLGSPLYREAVQTSISRAKIETSITDRSGIEYSDMIFSEKEATYLHLLNNYSKGVGTLYVQK